MTTVFEKSDEWGGLTIKLEADGFLIHYHNHMEEEIDGLEILVPYGTWGFEASSLQAGQGALPTDWERLSEMAQNDARLPIASRAVKVVNEGVALDRSRRKKGTKPVAAVEPRREVVRQGSGIEGGTSWYTVTLHKEDESGYGDCHDLFTTMYLTHGMPYGMALWTKSNFATDENMFFAQIPGGVKVEDDPLFRRFLFTECAPPSRIGLSLLVGHLDKPPEANFSAKRRGHWWRSKAATAGAGNVRL